jgi:hypothetical protein
MRRRKMLIGLGSLAAGGAAATGTGAFTSVTADRTITVNTANDNDAFLQLTPSDGENGAYAEQDGGTLEIAFDGSNTDSGEPTGNGINDNAKTIIRDVFDITNQGTQAVFVWIEGLGDDPVGVFSDDVASGTAVGNGDTGMGPNNPGATPDLPPVNVPEDHRVDPGETQGAIGFSFDTTGSNTVPSSLDITVVAEAVSEFPDGNTVANN